MSSAASAKKSVPGTYRGYSLPVANGYEKTAVYVAVRDGCRLATDIYRPTLNGRPLGQRLPTVVISTGYRRSFVLKRGEMWRDMYFPQFEYGDVVSWVTRGARLRDRHVAQWLEPVDHLSPGQFREWLLNKASVREFIIMHGYNLITLDNRSTGASFGRCDQLDHQTQGMDLADLFQWIVRQPWSCEDIGMLGNSWLGLAQNAAISCNPRYLKVVMPVTAGEDTFVPMYPGGLYNVGLMRQWYQERYEHEQGGYEADVVDEDLDGSLRAAAVKERQPRGDEVDLPWILTIPTPDEREEMLDRYSHWSRDRYEQNARYLDRDLPDGTRGSWKMGHLDPSLANKSRIGYYGYGGYWDLLAYDMAMAHAALTVPRKMLLGPWNHANWIGSDAQESLRWLDHHLKGIDNGIMREPAVTFSTSHPDKPLKWYGAPSFPPAGVTPLTLHVTPADAAQPLLGRLDERPSSSSDASLAFTVDYGVTSGLESRQWGYALGRYLNIRKLEPFRDRILTICTAPLTHDLEITGHPVLKLPVEIDAKAGAVVAFLQDIAPDGTAYYLSDGQLNLRDRKVSEPPFDNIGLPYQSIRERDRLPVEPGQVMELHFALNPVSWVLPAGHRLCLTLTGADLDNLHQKPIVPAPRMIVYCNARRPATLELPVIKKDTVRGAEPIEDAFEGLPLELQRATDPTTLEPHVLQAIQSVN